MFRFSSVRLFLHAEHNELSSLNSVLYVKQFEIAVADSLGRVNLWDTRVRDSCKSSMTFSL